MIRAAPQRHGLQPTFFSIPVFELPKARCTTTLRTAMRRTLACIYLCSLNTAAGCPGGAAEPTTRPVPQLETGMHTAAIRRLATDAKGSWAVTASDDKTA